MFGLEYCRRDVVSLAMRLICLITLLGMGLTANAASPSRVNGRFVATAYSVTGITASGEWTHRHVIAADPDVLPIGSRVKVLRAGRYSGEYVVADTGAKIQGRRVDIYMPNEQECKRFGVKPVRIKVIALGDGTRQAVKQADQTVKAEVAKDVAKGTVGNAATEVDWAQKGKPVAAAIKADADQTPVTGTPSASTTSTTAVPATATAPKQQ
jgi:3D (Asp-Asp-Asp) domain-containing protein